MADYDELESPLPTCKRCSNELFMLYPEDWYCPTCNQCPGCFWFDGAHHDLCEYFELSPAEPDAGRPQ
jgi:rubredoxin